MAARKYRLYAARVTGETVALAEKERSRIDEEAAHGAGEAEESDK
jgi:hypothetical protein